MSLAWLLVCYGVSGWGWLRTGEKLDPLEPKLNMLGRQIKSFTGGGVDLDQSQTFQKSDFPTGREGIGGQDVWD